MDCLRLGDGFGIAIGGRGEVPGQVGQHPAASLSFSAKPARCNVASVACLVSRARYRCWLNFRAASRSNFFASPQPINSMRLAAPAPGSIRLSPDLALKSPSASAALMAPEEARSSCSAAPDSFAFWNNGRIAHCVEAVATSLTSRAMNVMAGHRYFPSDSKAP